MTASARLPITQNYPRYLTRLQGAIGVIAPAPVERQETPITGDEIFEPQSMRQSVLHEELRLGNLHGSELLAHEGFVEPAGDALSVGFYAAHEMGFGEFQSG